MPINTGSTEVAVETRLATVAPFEPPWVDLHPPPDTQIELATRPPIELRSGPPGSIDTRRVRRRREVRYENYLALLNDAESLASGPIRVFGNWSLGQILAHLALSMQLSIDGLDEPTPWYTRLFGRWLKKNWIRGPRKPGFKLTGGLETMLQPGSATLAEGMSALTRAVNRLQSETDRRPHPLIGELSLEEWDSLHLRHAELHMGFVAADRDWRP